MGETNFAARVRARYTAPTRRAEAERSEKVAHAAQLLTQVGEQRVDMHFSAIPEGENPYPLEGFRADVVIYNPKQDFQSGNEPHAHEDIAEALSVDREATLAPMKKMMEDAG